MNEPQKNDLPVSVHLYQGDVEYDSRIKKSTSELLRTGVVGRCRIYGISRPAVPMHQKARVLSPGIELRYFFLVTKFLGKRKISRGLQITEWMVRTLFSALFISRPVYHVHSAFCLPLGVILKLLRPSSALIYDPHELESERININKFLRNLISRVERLGIPFCDRVYVVGNFIKYWYEQNYPSAAKKIGVIRNIPVRASTVIPAEVNLREFYGLKNERLFLYQGLLGLGRGIEIVLEAFARLPLSQQVVFLGFGPLEKLIKDYSERYPNIHYFGKVPNHQLLSYTQQADVGLNIIESKSLSYHYCLPNKFFEYLLAGVPVLSSHLPEIASVFHENAFGWTVSANPDDLAAKIDGISEADLLEKKQAVAKAPRVFNWEREYSQVVEWYRSWNAPLLVPAEV